MALEILLDGPLSRAELSRRVGLSPGSLTRLTKPMVESGLLVEVVGGPTDARAGRPSQPLDLDAAAHHFVGIKLTGDSAIGVLTTLRAEAIASAERPLTDPAPSTVAELVLELTDDLAVQVPAGTPITGLGVAVGGRVDVDVSTVAELQRVVSAVHCVHLTLDTGLHRAGSAPDQWIELTRAVAHYEALGAVTVRGIWSHLSHGDSPDAVQSRRQLQLLRTGVSLARRAGLRPGDHVADRDTTVALVPLGYADGIPRAAVHQASVLCRGDQPQPGGTCTELEGWDRSWGARTRNSLSPAPRRCPNPPSCGWS